MKIALLFSGPSRGLAHCVKTWSFLEHVDDIYHHTRIPFDPGEGYIRDIPAFGSTRRWRQSLDAAFAGAATIDHDSKIAWGMYMIDEPGRHAHVSGRAMDVRPYYAHPPGVILGMAWYMRQQAFKLIANPEQYDLIAYVRPDAWFKTPMDLSKLTPDKFWTPKLHRWGGLNDRIAVGSPAAMRHYCDMYDHLNDDIDTLAVGNMEERLCNWMLKMPLLQFGWINTDFYFVKASGEHRVIPAFDYGDYTLPRYKAVFENCEVR